MSGLKIFLVVLLAIDSIALTVIVLMQEGQAQGLGTISGMADSYWGQNKGRSLEGKLVRDVYLVKCERSSDDNI